ncbi:MAG: hypothetical protein IIA02_13030 [Proteobacteria bacterium]|uniref:hypothetical protein n=1 Tax=Aquabacterium sp. TaxID=1872578 RepID=UPI0035C70D20|nr:hypothetical protein [Pseudomonadota bacterium]
MERPTEHISIVSATMHDHATALLTLDDGRQLLVDLTGVREPGADGLGHAVATLSLSDPSLAMMDPEEIRARLRILPDIHWCSHWNDASLAVEGDAVAAKAAKDALDGWDAADEAEFLAQLPKDVEPSLVPGLRRETVLHREVKAILESASSIETPGLEVVVERDPPDEFAGEWETASIRKMWMTGPRQLNFGDVRLEKKVASIVPDVIADLNPGKVQGLGGTMTWVDGDFDEDEEDTYPFTWPAAILVEVTVTHGIDDEKLRRIRDLDMPTLEIDLGALGGTVTRENLRDLVVNQLVGKRWVHHPVLRAKRRVLESAVDEHPVTLRYRERLLELRRPAYLAQPAAYWAARYISAMTSFHDANVGIKRAGRKHVGNGPKPQFLGSDSELWQQVEEASEALAAHGLPGALDRMMVDESGMVARILSIQQNRGVGYDMNTGYQVLNAIMQSGPDNKRWHTIYTMAVKAYGLEAHFTKAQADSYARWRQSIIDGVDLQDVTYLRPSTYDKVLGVLFPEMARGIAKKYGLQPEPL